MTTTTLPPLRYAVSQDDFDPEIGSRLRIFLDGVEQREVIEYDCDAGTLLRNKLNAEGNVQIDPTQPDQVWTEHLTGTVTVEWKD